MLPNRDYWLSLPGMVDDVGLSNLEYDGDGVERHHRLVSQRREAPRIFLGPLLAARATGQALAAETWTVGNRRMGTHQYYS